MGRPSPRSPGPRRSRPSGCRPASSPPATRLRSRIREASSTATAGHERIAVGEFGQVLVTGWGRASLLEDGADPAVDVRALEAILERFAPRWRSTAARSVIELQSALERRDSQAAWPASARVAVGGLLALLALAAVALWKLSS